MSADEVIAKQLAKAAFGWVPLVTLLGRLYTAKLYRWSSRILRIAVPFLARPLDVMSVAGYVLFKLHEAD